MLSWTSVQLVNVGGSRSLTTTFHEHDAVRPTSSRAVQLVPTVVEPAVDGTVICVLLAREHVTVGVTPELSLVLYV